MKIYALNIKINPQNIFSNNINTKDLCKTSNTCHYIYSDDGMFLLQNNQLYKLIPDDVPCDTITFNNTDFIVDCSTYTFRKDIYNVPWAHIIQTIEKIEYKYSNSSLVSLIIEKNNGKITDVYFETMEKNLNIQLKNDIIKYLSLFNDIKQ